MAVAEPAKRLSVSDYLELEHGAGFKSEFYEAEMFAMAGGSPQHSQIASNLIRQASGQWLLHEAAGMDASLTLPCVEIALPFAEVFAKVKFERGPIRVQTPPRG